MKDLDGWRRGCEDECLRGQALDGMCIGMIMTNAAGRVTWVNRSAQRILEMGEDDVRGELLSHVLKDPQMSEFWHRARNAPTTLMGEVTLTWPHSIELKVNASNCVNTDGECIGRGLLFCDVTEERSVQVKLTEAATRRLLDLTRRESGSGSPVEGLTATELKVLSLVGTGLGNQDIAGELGVAPSTIRTHLKSIYRKTELSSRAEAISFALQNGLS
ncbi:MAG: LuxR C-terminal-related transcriptional regulator [Planctomycetota bacterium]